jgi:hypothetical protein
MIVLVPAWQLRHEQLADEIKKTVNFINGAEPLAYRKIINIGTVHSRPPVPFDRYRMNA